MGKNESQIATAARSLNWNAHQMAAVDSQDRLGVSSSATVEERIKQFQNPNTIPANMLWNVELGSGPGPEVSHEKRVRTSHLRVLFDLRNVQKRATKSDTLGHCLCRSTCSWLVKEPPIETERGKEILSLKQLLV